VRVVEARPIIVVLNPPFFQQRAASYGALSFWYLNRQRQRACLFAQLWIPTRAGWEKGTVDRYAMPFAGFGKDAAPAKCYQWVVAHRTSIRWQKPATHGILCEFKGLIAASSRGDR
jgi:hypothetical protein